MGFLWYVKAMQKSHKSSDKKLRRRITKAGPGSTRLRTPKHPQSEPKKMHKFDFVKSAFLPTDYPVHPLPEVAIVGRSNSGKSTLINLLAGRSIAKTSQTPGKTRLLNFFSSLKYMLVDMPGYGFASRGGDEIREWQRLIEEYLFNRDQLVGIILVMDIRRDWETDEAQLKSWAFQQGIPLLVVLSKADKMGYGQVQASINRIQKVAETQLVFACSSLEKKGHREIEDYFYKNWIKSE